LGSRLAFSVACLAAGAVSASCVARDLSRDRFACERGGSCEDGSRSLDAPGELADAPLDGDSLADGSEDGGPALDAGAVDTGVIPQSCRGAQPIPADGVARGDTTSAHDDFQGTCSLQMGGRDNLWSTGWPGDLALLDITTYGSGYDTVVYAFHADCNATSEFRCNDDRAPSIDLTSRIHVRNVARGQYFIVVDGYDGNALGPYTLAISGIVADGQPCDPSLAFLGCEKGFCLPDAVGSVCKEPKDCRDGLDNNDNGMSDEDAASCPTPPEVTCPPNQMVAPGTALRLTGRATSANPVVARKWTVTSAPAAVPILAPTDSADTASITVSLSGDYVLRYTAVDDAAQAVACETRIQVPPGADLRVELFWDPPDLALATDLDLHLLDAAATKWFDPMNDCYPATCATALAWGAASGRDGIGQGPEAIHVVTAMDGASYRVGVHYVSTDLAGPAIAHLRITCRNTIHDVGMASLPIGTGDPNVDNSFWKAADVMMNGTGCTVTNLVDAMNQPLIVTATIARGAR
jgi:hypothetical protein